MLRDHDPIVIDQFNGFWKRGDADSVPIDHFPECNNIQYIESGFRTRDGVDTLPAKNKVLRMYTYASGLGDSFLILSTDNCIYHSVIGGSTFLVLGPITNMTDFAFVAFNQRAYIAPGTNDSPGGMSDEFIYVYDGNQIALARKAAGFAPTDADGALAAANSGTAGSVETGIHIFGVVYETDTGFWTSIGPDTLPALTATGGFKVDLSNIPVSPNSYVTKRLIVATKAIDPNLYTGNTKGYEFFFVPDGEINDNTSTTLTVDFFDGALLDSANYLFDLFEEIPAAGTLTTYHNRLIAADFATDDNTSLVRVSFPGEPEGISQVDGLLLLPRDGLGITNAQEYRDVLYVFKVNQTHAFTDNGDVPSSWPQVAIDQGLGSGKHGICIVGANGSINIEYLVILNYRGIFVFNGVFQRPELSWKIKDYWLPLDKIAVGIQYQILNDALNQVLYINLPDVDNTILFGDYCNGFNHKDIRWGKWTFDFEPTSIAIYDKTNILAIGARV